jgi:hypothetical protein
MTKKEKDKVLKIVDRCFHMYAADYRNDAQKQAKQMLSETMPERHISLADHREAMRMAAVGYVREIEDMRTARNAATRTAEMLHAQLAEARRQVAAISAPLDAAYSRFGHLDNVLEMAHDPDGTDDTNPWHACARDLWRAVKAAQTANKVAKEGGAQ